MSILFENVMLCGTPAGSKHFVAVDGAYITAVTDIRPEGTFDRVVAADGCLLIPGFVNAHTHAAMTLFRGYGEDLPLQRWLEERIFPAEDRLTERAVFLGTQLSIAEMLAGGVTSFSDMYFFCDATARAVAESGIKANISRSVVSFDENADYKNDARVREGIALFRNWNGAENGRILVDLSLHAEYTNCPAAVQCVAEAAATLGTRVHIHLSETEREHTEGIARRGVTPTAFFLKNHLFDVPVVAAHCVYLTDEDRAILAAHGASAVHNPISNLKLGSGMMPLTATLAAGVNVALGTDGAASNNRLDLLRELQTALLIAKGSTRSPDCITAVDGLALATANGARAQGRMDCGVIAVGARADLALMDLRAPHNLPVVAPEASLAYSAAASDTRMTVVDGRILYENGEFYTLDVEKLKSEFTELRTHYFD